MRSAPAIARPALLWAAAVLGLLLALAFFAPARWLTDRVTQATAGQVQLVNARGTVWNGSADLVLSAGTDSRDRAGLPGGLQWRLRPGLAGAWPALKRSVRRSSLEAYISMYWSNRARICRCRSEALLFMATACAVRYLPLYPRVARHSLPFRGYLVLNLNQVLRRQARG